MKIKKIILHVGIPKTGSTSIQNTLLANSELIEKFGYLYIKSWGDQNQVLFNLFKKDPLRYHSHRGRNLTNDDIDALNQKKVEILEKAIQSSKGQILILSAEGASSFEQDELESLKTFFGSICGYDVPIDIFVYVRAPLDWIFSMCQQLALRMGSSAINTVAQMLSPGLFKNRLYPSLQVFGKNKVHIHRFEDAIAYKKGPVGHFLHHIGFSDNQIDQLTIIRSNESRCAEVLELIEYIENAEPILNRSPNGGINPARTLDDIRAIFQIKGVKFFLPFEQKRKLLGLCTDDIQWLKDNTGIDYTDMVIPKDKHQELYQEETLQQFIDSFPNLTYTMQRLFLDFFRSKYEETGEEKFKKLFVPESIPSKTFGYVTAFRKRFETTNVFDQQVIPFDFTVKPYTQEYAQLFIDYGRKYNEQDSYRQLYDKHSMASFDIKIDANEKVTCFRLDPSAGPSITQIVDLKVNGKKEYKLIQGNYHDHFENIFSFFRYDPRILFKSPEPIKTIEIKLIIDRGTYAFAHAVQFYVANVYKERQLVKNREKRISKLIKQTETQQQRIEELTRQLADFQQRNGKL